VKQKSQVSGYHGQKSFTLHSYFYLANMEPDPEANAA